MNAPRWIRHTDLALDKCTDAPSTSVKCCILGVSLAHSVEQPYVVIVGKGTDSNLWCVLALLFCPAFLSYLITLRPKYILKERWNLKFFLKSRDLLKPNVHLPSLHRLWVSCFISSFPPIEIWLFVLPLLFQLAQNEMNEMNSQKENVSVLTVKQWSIVGTPHTSINALHRVNDEVWISLIFCWWVIASKMQASLTGEEKELKCFNADKLNGSCKV